MTESFYGRTLIIIGALAYVAGCGGGSPPAPTISALVTGPRGWPDAAKRAKPILFVSDLQGNVVRLYDPDKPNAQQEGSITDGVMSPQGIAVDSHGALYVSTSAIQRKRSRFIRPARVSRA